jgi:lysozyme family protein
MASKNKKQAPFFFYILECKRKRNLRDNAASLFNNAQIKQGWSELSSQEREQIKEQARVHNESIEDKNSIKTFFFLLVSGTQYVCI